MADPQDSIPPIGKIAPEEAARRDCWTPGYPVQLADDGTWRLPRVDWGLLLLHPGLLAIISRTYAMADEVWRAEPDTKRHVMAIAIYHTQLMQLGVALLQLNYDLPDERWRRLVSFDRLGAMLRLSLAVSEAVADSVPAWMPFHRTNGRDGEENLHLN